MILQPLPRSRNWLQILYGSVGLTVGVISGMLVVGVPDALKLFVIVVGVFAFAVSLARVDWGLLVLVFITYTRFSDVAVQYHGAPSVAKSFILLLILAVLARWIVYGERPDGWQKPVILLAGFGLASVASILYAVDADVAWEASTDFFKDALIVIIIGILLKRSNQLRHVVWALLIAGMFLGSLSVFQYLTGSFDNNFWGFSQAPRMHIVGESSANRISGPFGSPNVYAQIMLVIIPLALDRFWNERNRWVKVIAGYGLVVVTLTVIFTFSRSGFVALVAMVGVLVLYYRPKMSAMVSLLLILLFLLQFLPPEYTERIQTLTLIRPGSNYNPIGEVSYRGRASEFLVGWMMFRDNPLLGVGAENYPILYQDYSRRVGLDPRTEQRSPHNLYIEVLAEQGLFGFFFFALIIWVAFKGTVKARSALYKKEHPSLLGMVTAFSISLFGFLVASLFIHSSYPRFLWLIVGIVLALPNIVQNELETTNIDAK